MSSDISSKLKEIDDTLMKKLLNYLLNNEICSISMNDYIKCYSISTEIIKGTNSLKIDAFYSYIKDRITYFIGEISKKVSQESDENFLQAFHKETENVKIFAFWLERVFKTLANIKDIQMTLFTLKVYKKNFLLDIKDKLFGQLNKEINNDRSDKLVDRNFIRRIIKIIEQCEIEDPIADKINDIIDFVGKEKLQRGHNTTDSVKQKVFSISSKTLLREWIESQLKSCSEYVVEKGSKEIKIFNAPEYINSSLKYCLEEDNRKLIYLPDEMHKRLDAINYNSLIKSNVQVIKEMESGIMNMLVNNKRKELTALFNLYERQPDSLISIMEEMKKYITSKGEETYKNKEISMDPVKFITALIIFKNDNDSLVSECFKNNYRILDCKSKAFSHFMSKEHYAKQLASYTDWYFKAGIKGKVDDQIEEDLNNIINIFRCINNKLVFQLEYVKKLSERMLNKKSLNEYAEKTIVSKFKADQGVGYVSRMSNIFEDLEKSVSLIDRFRLQKHKGYIAGINFNCQILQNGAWEVDRMREFNLDISKLSPQRLKECKAVWESFYNEIHNAHKLIWVYGGVSILI